MLAALALGVQVPLTRDLAISAVEIARDLKLAMADSIMLATARAYGATFWTQDAHFEGIEGVRYFAKPAPGIA